MFIASDREGEIQTTAQTVSDKVKFELEQMNAPSKALRALSDAVDGVKHTPLTKDEHKILCGKHFIEVIDDVRETEPINDAAESISVTQPIAALLMSDDELRKFIMKINDGSAPGISGVGMKHIKYLMNTQPRFLKVFRDLTNDISSEPAKHMRQVPNMYKARTIFIPKDG